MEQFLGCDEMKDDKQTKGQNKCQECGAESEIGAHGIKNGQVYDEYYCHACYKKTRR